MLLTQVPHPVLFFVRMSERRSKWDTPAQDTGSSSNDGNAAAAAAAAAAARIAAQFNAHQTGNTASTSQSNPKKSEERSRERDPNDGEFVHDIEINDIRNRYLLTKAQTQNQIHEDTGANITTKGLWYPDKTLATSSEPPLFLHISAMTKDSLDQAIEKVNEIIQSEMPQLIEDRQAKRVEYENQKRQQSSQQPSGGGGGRREWIEEKVPINLESLRNFNIRRKIVGPQGMFVKYIQTETGTRVQIKGLGSGFNERNTDREANEPMFINIAGPEPEKVAEAKELALDLLDAVRTEHAKAYQSLMQEWGGSQQQQHGYNEPAQGGYGGYNTGYQYNAGPHGGDYSINGQGWAGQNQQSHSSMGAPPVPEDDVPPPPPPDDIAPPPPAEPAPSKKEKTAEEIALDKYWQDYIEWERSFKAYHNRLPSTEEGFQAVPHEYRK